MAAPTVVYIEAGNNPISTGTNVDQPSITSGTGAAVGDLCVITAVGTDQSTGTKTAPIYKGGSDAGFTEDSVQGTSSGSGRVIIWSKVLVSGDFTSGELKQFTVNGNTFGSTGRSQIWVFRHGSGWDSGRVASIHTTAANNTNGTAYTLTDVASPAMVLACSGYSTVGAGQTIAWDGGSARTPYVDASANTVTTGGHTSHYGAGIVNSQSDYNEYDGSGTITSYAWQLGVSNTTHRFTTIVYQTAILTVSGTATVAGGGTFTASGVPTVSGTATLAGGGTFAATGVKTVSGIAALDGGGTFTAQQQGTTVIQGTATLLGGGTFTAQGGRLISGTAALAGGGTFHATGTRTVLGAAALTGGGTFHATGIVGAIPQGSGGVWTAGSASVPGGEVWTDAVAHLAGGGTFQAAGIQLPPNSGFAQLFGGGTFQATGTPVIQGEARLEGGGVFQASGNVLSHLTTRLAFHPRQRLVVRE